MDRFRATTSTGRPGRPGAGRRHRVGRPRHPARPADRARPLPQGARRQAGVKQVPDDVAGRLLDRFEEVGLVDDEAFARSWISGRQAGKGLARRALAQELRRKGVPDEVARAALDEVDPDDEEAAARALVRKKMRTLTRVDEATATRRLVGMLARKGYSPGVAFAVVRDELGADPAEADGPEGYLPSRAASARSRSSASSAGVA